MNCKNRDIWFLLTAVFAFLFTVSFGMVNLSKYNIFSTTTFGWQYPHVFYQLFHGKTIFDVGTDHAVLFFLAMPIGFVEALLYQCAPRAEVLLAFQTVLMGLGAVPAYLLVRKITEDSFFAFSFAIAYLTNPIITSGAVLGFIPPSIALFFLLWAFYFLETGKRKIFILFILLANASKIDAVVCNIVFGIFLSLSKQNRASGLWVFRISLVWLIFFIAFYGIYLVANGQHFPVAMAHLEAYGSSLHQVGNYVLTHPLHFLKNIYHTENMLWNVYTGFPYIFIFLAPAIFLVSLPESIFILVRNHHSSGHFILYAFVLWGAVRGLQRLLSRLCTYVDKKGWGFFDRRRIYLCLGIAIIIYSASVHYRSGALFDFGKRLGVLPFSRGFSWDFYHETSHSKTGKAMIEKIPEGKRCLTLQSLAMHFRKCSLIGIYNEEYLHNQADWDYILLDLNADDFYQISKSRVFESLDLFLANGRYGVVEFNDGWLLLELNYSMDKNQLVRKTIHENQKL